MHTSLREWAYARAYETSEQRATELPRWLHRYNGIALMAISDQSHRSADSVWPEQPPEAPQRRLEATNYLPIVRRIANENTQARPH